MMILKLIFKLKEQHLHQNKFEDISEDIDPVIVRRKRNSRMPQVKLKRFDSFENSGLNNEVFHYFNKHRFQILKRWKVRKSQAHLVYLIALYQNLKRSYQISIYQSLSRRNKIKHSKISKKNEVLSSHENYSCGNILIDKYVKQYQRKATSFSFGTSDNEDEGR